MAEHHSARKRDYHYASLVERHYNPDDDSKPDD